MYFLFRKRFVYIPIPLSTAAVGFHFWIHVSRIFFERNRMASESVSDPLPSDVEPPAKRTRLEVEASTSETDKVTATVSNSSESQVKEQHVDSVLEPEVGITELINKSSPRFFGLLKDRYSDFIVHEIRRDGSVVRLTDTTTIPQLTGGDNQDVSSADGYQFSEEIRTRLDELLAKDKRGKQYVDIEAPSEKEARKAIHHAIRQQFHGAFESSMKEAKGQQVIRVKYCGKGRQVRQRFAPENEYLKFTLLKFNQDGFGSISSLAQLSGSRRASFTTCGLKDRRAITTQEVTARRVSAEALANVKLNLVKVGNFQYTNTPLRLGDHSGNHFTIVLRYFRGSEEHLNTGMRSLSERGFINYFGMQRFSTSRTHLLGKALYTGQYKEAVDMVLDGLRRFPGGNRTKAHKVWIETRDAAAALSLLDRRPSAERDVLSGLKARGADCYKEAMGQITQHTLSLYFHAYQAWLFNLIASRRIGELGMEPIVGDLVLPPSAINGVDLTDGSADSTTAIDPDDDTGSGDADGAEKSKTDKMEELLQVVTEENISQFTIFDVVLPIVGARRRFPENTVGDWYQDLLREHGIEKIPNGVRFYASRFVSLPGGYRHVIAKPTDVSWKLLHYSDQYAPLLLSDLDILEGKEEIQGLPAGEGVYQAVRIEFSLKTSCYATMALREVCEVDSSAAHQATFSKSMKSANAAAGGHDGASSQQSC